MEASEASCPTLLLQENPWGGYIDAAVAVTMGIATLLVLLRLLFGSKPGRFYADPADDGDPAVGHDDRYRKRLDISRSFLMPFWPDALSTKQDFIEALIALGDGRLEGWLLVKKGADRSKSWKKRFVLLDANARLKYYSNAESARRNINIKGSLTVHSVKPADTTEFGANTLEVHGTLGGTYYVRAEDAMNTRKWLCVLTKRAMQGTRPGYIGTGSSHGEESTTKQEGMSPSDVPSSKAPTADGSTTASEAVEPGAAVDLRSHTLEAVVEDMSYSREPSLRQFYVVVKFKSELHDHGCVPVGQTIPKACDKGVVNWNETLKWHFQDHLCEECKECQTVDLTTGCFNGLPEIMVLHIYEIRLRCMTTKVAQISISLKETFGYWGMKEASMHCSWPVISMSNKLVGHLSLKLQYTVGNAAGPSLAPFLVTTDNERELVGEYHLHPSVKDCSEFFHTFYANGTMCRWEEFHRLRGDSEMEVTEWNDSAEFGGQVRVMTCRSLTNASIGPASTMTTNTQHVTFSTEEGPNPDRFVLETKVYLHDIPYGDCFTIEQMTVVEKATGESGDEPHLVARVYLGIPFSKACMFKSKVISATKEGVSASMKLCYEELNKVLDGKSNAVPLVPFLSSTIDERELVGEYELDPLITDCVDFFNFFYANGNIHRWEGYFTEIGETEHDYGNWKCSDEHGGQVRELKFRALTKAPIGPPTTTVTLTQHIQFRDVQDADPDLFIVEARMVLHDAPFGDTFYVESVTTVERQESGKLTAKLHFAVIFTRSCLFKSKVIAGTRDGFTRSSKLMYDELNKAVKNERESNAEGVEANATNGRGSIAAPGSGRRRVLARLNSTLDGSVALEEIFENQRVSIFGKWGPNHLLPTDRARFTNRNGDVELSFEQITLPPHWVWTTPWKIDKNYTECDDDGWSYASDFPRFKSHLARGRSNVRRLGASVRRRRWIRMMAYAGPDGDVSSSELTSSSEMETRNSSDTLRSD